MSRPVCYNIFDRVKIAAEKVAHCKLAIYDEAAVFDDSPELVEYMRALEKFEETINTARIACIFTKRRYNVNYVNSVTHPWAREEDLNEQSQGYNQGESGDDKTVPIEEEGKEEKDEDTNEVRLEKTITTVAKKRKKRVVEQHEEEVTEEKRFK